MSDFPWRERKERKVVSWDYYDGNSIFKGAPKREEVNYVVCSCSDKCEAFKLGKCGTKGIFCGWCPYGNEECEQGFTRASGKWGDLKRKYLRNNPDNHIFLQPLDFLCPMGEYHLNVGLPWIEDFIENECKEKGFEKQKDYMTFTTQSVIPIELFTKDFIIRLLQYKPRSWLNDSLWKDYEKKLPWWCLRLKRTFPKLYNEVLQEYPKVEEYVNSVDFKGKKAYLETLLPGQVKVNGAVCGWNGKILTANGTQFGSNLIKTDLDKDCTVTICVTEKTTCEIVDNSTVNENTKIID